MGRFDTFELFGRKVEKLTHGVLLEHTVGSVPPERAGTAAGMFNTSRLAGETIGVAVIGTVLVGLVQNKLRAADALQGGGSPTCSGTQAGKDPSTSASCCPDWTGLGLLRADQIGALVKSWALA